MELSLEERDMVALSEACHCYVINVQANWHFAVTKE